MTDRHTDTQTHRHRQTIREKNNLRLKEKFLLHHSTITDQRAAAGRSDFLFLAAFELYQLPTERENHSRRRRRRSRRRKIKRRRLPAERENHSTGFEILLDFAGRKKKKRLESGKMRNPERREVTADRQLVNGGEEPVGMTGQL